LLTFTSLGLSKQTLTALEACNFTEPTEIQLKTIPILMSGRDVMGSAQTGSGKTAAYALPIIECLEEPADAPRALVLLPTRELALQVEEQFKIFGSKAKIRTVTVYGGTGYERQIRALKRGVDVIIATPGRLLDLLERKLVNVKEVEMFVLDEADRLLDMGFMPQVRRIATQLQKERQTIMFSATIDRKVERIAAEFLINPAIVRANECRVEPAEIDQTLHFVTEFGKDALLLKVIQDSGVDSMLVFTKTKRKASWVTNRLQDSKVKAEEIHGDVSQAQRERTLERFRRGEFAVLVATDVAARGLDVPAISHVINYDLPTSPEDYVHRIGRTGRMGRSGIAISFVSEEDRYMVRDIEKVIGKILDPDAQSRKVLSTPRRPMRGTRRRVVG